MMQRLITVRSRGDKEKNGIDFSSQLIQLPHLKPDLIYSLIPHLVRYGLSALLTSIKSM